MPSRQPLAVLCALLMGSCAGSDTLPVSSETAPVITFPDILPPTVLTGWPCPPFDIETTSDKVGDSDGDSLTDCQEEVIYSDPNDADSDGDLVGDLVEIGDIKDPTDSDFDDVPDILDTDDDGDGIPTAEEDEAPSGDGNGNPRDDDFDVDGIPNYLDVDDDNDMVFGLMEDLLAGDGDGDPRNDDVDGDDIKNWLDNDDDNDTAIGCEDVNGDRTITDLTTKVDGVDYFVDDTDRDGVHDFLDFDDDNDGIDTPDEDWDGDGDPCNDDFDGDLVPDFRELDEDNDDAPDLLEDVNGNGWLLDDDIDFDGSPNHRDFDDDGDGIESRLEDLDIDTTDKKNTGEGQIVDDDTDGDGYPNFLDRDDDGDRCLTIDEDTAKGAHLDDTVVDSACTLWYTLTLQASGFALPDGAPVYGIVTQQSDGETVSNGYGTIQGGMLVTDFRFALSTGDMFTVDFFADEDGNALCNGAEGSWRVTGLTTTGADEVETQAQAAIQNPAACDSF